MNEYEAMVKANMWKSLAYIGAGSAKPLWALLALSAPSFVVKAAETVNKENKDESES